MCRNPSHVSRARYRVSGNSEDSEAENTISWHEVRDVRANPFDDTANFIAKNARIWGVARIKSQRFQHVAKIHSGRFHFDQHLTRSAWRQFQRSKEERVETTALAAFQTQRQDRIQPLLSAQAAQGQSSKIAPVTTQD